MSSDGRLLFTSDLHGSTLCFRKAISAAIETDSLALVLGGDLSGKTMTPVVRQISGVWEAWFGEGRETVEGASALIELESAISATGSYPIRLTQDEFLHLESSKGAQREHFARAMKGRLEQWLHEAEETLGRRNIGLHLICGNDDLEELDDVINASNYATNLEKEGAEVAGCELVGDSSANITPFCGCPRDRAESVIEERLRTRISVLQHPDSSVLVTHVPPFGTGIDNAVELDEQLRQRTAAGSSILKPAGSTAVRKIIEEIQPALSLHGHIHESPGFARLGRTLSCNPGSEYSNGITRCVLISLRDQSVRGHMLLSR